MLSPINAPSSKKTRPSKKHWKPQASPALETNLAKALDHCHTAGPQPSFVVAGLGENTAELTQNKSTGASLSSPWTFKNSVIMHATLCASQRTMGQHASAEMSLAAGAYRGQHAAQRHVHTQKPLGTKVCKFQTGVALRSTVSRDRLLHGVPLRAGTGQ